MHSLTRTHRAGHRASRLPTTAIRILRRFFLRTATRIPEMTARQVLKITRATTYFVTT